MGSKRPASMMNMSQMIQTKKKNEPPKDKSGGSGGSSFTRRTPYMSQPIPDPTAAVCHFLMQARSEARRRRLSTSTSTTSVPVEVEARLGLMLTPCGQARVLPSGAVTLPAPVGTVHSFLIDAQTRPEHTGCRFEGGITSAHSSRTVLDAEPEVLARAFCGGGTADDANGNTKKALRETESSETVYSGYPGGRRVVYETTRSRGGAGTTGGASGASGTSTGWGRMEEKIKLATMDVALPSAPYDLRLCLSTENSLDERVSQPPPPGHSSIRHKRRRTYIHRSNEWRLDLTEVTTYNSNNNNSNNNNNNAKVLHELELELLPQPTNHLVTAEMDAAATKKYCRGLALRLWSLLNHHLNPSSDCLEVSSYLVPHPDRKAVRAAVAHCTALGRYADAKDRDASSSWTPVITAKGVDAEAERRFHTPPGGRGAKFVGCMPINFTRHHLDKVQRGGAAGPAAAGPAAGGGTSDGTGYYVSEKTDGVRYLMVFVDTTTVVLVARDLEGYRVVPARATPMENGNASKTTTMDTDINMDDPPLSWAASQIPPGTVLDGEVVIHRKLRRPVYICFDVLCYGDRRPLMRELFRDRLHCLRHDFTERVFDPANLHLSNNKASQNNNQTTLALALPLLRKNFCRRTELDRILLSRVQMERGVRIYSAPTDGMYHATDGVIFQPNRPYKTGTDVHLHKWKYLDTVTIDVEYKCNDDDHHNDNYNDNNNDDGLPTPTITVTGPDYGTAVDLSRIVVLPRIERFRLHADQRAERTQQHAHHPSTRPTIAEVGCDPATGEWYYTTLRPDKTTPNHISTVLGTLLELAESLDTDELRYRMNVPQEGGRDDFRPNHRRMMRQLLQHQRKVLHHSAPPR